MDIIIIDDHKIIREGLRILLKPYPEFRILAEGGSWTALTELLLHHNPDTLILDLKLPGGDSLALIPDLRFSHPDMKILLMSGEWNSQLVCIAEGLKVQGIVAKESGIEMLLLALQHLLEDRIFKDPFLISLQEEGDTMDIDQLSQREIEVMRGFAQGKTYKEIGKLLFISPRTVETHKNNILKKMKWDTTHEMILYAISHNIC